jgi:hypothetical protein
MVTKEPRSDNLNTFPLSSMRGFVKTNGMQDAATIERIRRKFDALFPRVSFHAAAATSTIHPGRLSLNRFLATPGHAVGCARMTKSTVPCQGGGESLPE